MATTINRNEALSRYEINVDGALGGVADFREGGHDVLVFPHTEIFADRRGQGLAAELVGAALDDVRRRGKTVVPACSYVAQFIDQHPAYADLLASSGP